MKYSIAIGSPGVPPGSLMVARTSPALISGKVIPSSTDCGRIRRPERAILAASAVHSVPSAGSSAEYDQSVRVTNSSWKTSASTPMTASPSA